MKQLLTNERLEDAKGRINLEERPYPPKKNPDKKTNNNTLYST